MSGLKAMFMDEGFNGNIRCKFISDYFMIESSTYTDTRLFSEIERSKLDVVVMDLRWYAKIYGIETSRVMRSRFDVAVVYI